MHDLFHRFVFPDFIFVFSSKMNPRVVGFRETMMTSKAQGLGVLCCQQIVREFLHQHLMLAARDNAGPERGSLLDMFHDL